MSRNVSADQPSGLWKRPPLVFVKTPPFVAIFGPARGQIYRKKAKKICKKLPEVMALQVWGLKIITHSAWKSMIQTLPEICRAPCLLHIPSSLWGDTIADPEKGPKLAFFIFFRSFFPYVRFWRGQISRKRVGRFEKWRGMIDKPILELLTFLAKP